MLHVERVEVDMQALAQRLRSGDTSVREAIIKEHIPWARYTARKFFSRHPQKKDDIVCWAVFGVVQAVEWIPTRCYDNNITPYIISTVKRYILDYLESDYTIRLPRSAFHNGRIKCFPLVLSRYQNTVIVEDENNYFVDGYILSFDVPEKPDIFNYEKEDFYDQYHLNDQEREVVEYKLAEYTFEEIGVKMGFTRQRAENIMANIREKVTWQNENS